MLTCDVPLAYDAERRALRATTPRPLVLTPVRSSAGLRATYLSRIERLLAEFQNSLVYWLKAAWRKEPTLAQDASAINNLKTQFSQLGRQWLKRFADAAPKLAKYFATKTQKRVETDLKRILKDGGFSVEFRMSVAAKNAYQAVIAENVGLIKSIATKHLSDVEGHVMRSVSQGGDLGTLTKTIQDQYGLARRRAALIAKDQNMKATAVLTRQRQIELGITTARWRHSAGGNEPRKSHVKASLEGVVYDVVKGWFDPDEGRYIQPGELINCRCVSQPIIPGFGKK